MIFANHWVAKKIAEAFANAALVILTFYSLLLPTHASFSCSRLITDTLVCQVLQEKQIITVMQQIKKLQMEPEENSCYKWIQTREH